MMMAAEIPSHELLMIEKTIQGGYESTTMPEGSYDNVSTSVNNNNPSTCSVVPQWANLPTVSLNYTELIMQPISPDYCSTEVDLRDLINCSSSHFAEMAIMFQIPCQFYGLQPYMQYPAGEIFVPAYYLLKFVDTPLTLAALVSHLSRDTMRKENRTMLLRFPVYNNPKLDITCDAAAQTTTSPPSHSAWSSPPTCSSKTTIIQAQT
jgi:hypothetical protein